MRIRIRSVVALSVFWVICTHATARAQTAGFGYGFIGPAAFGDFRDPGTAWNEGVGGEAWIDDHLSVGGEIGLLMLPYHPLPPALLLSLDVSHHFREHSGGGWRPFVTGGYSLLSAGRDAIGLFNVGGGIDRWLTGHTGVRFEIRDQILALPDTLGTLALGFRVGVLIR